MCIYPSFLNLKILHEDLLFIVLRRKGNVTGIGESLKWNENSSFKEKYIIIPFISLVLQLQKILTHTVQCSAHLPDKVRT